MSVKRFVYSVYRLFVLRTSTVSMSDDRKRLQKISPNLQAPYTVPKFEYEQPECDLSVIVPVYNVAPFLQECIESILEQQIYVNYEFNIIDDGSTDGKGVIAEVLGRLNRRVRVNHLHNKDFAGAENADINVSSGEWLMIVDTDDRFSSGILNAYLSAVETSQVDYISGLYTVMNESEITESQSVGLPCMSRLTWGRFFSRNG